MQCLLSLELCGTGRESPTGAQRRESREAPTRDAGQPERSGGNPEKRQRRDAGQPELYFDDGD
jgi:hypothetical protein